MTEGKKIDRREALQRITATPLAGTLSVPTLGLSAPVMGEVLNAFATEDVVPSYKKLLEEDEGGVFELVLRTVALTKRELKDFPGKFEEVDFDTIFEYHEDTGWSRKDTPIWDKPWFEAPLSRIGIYRQVFNYEPDKFRRLWYELRTFDLTTLEDILSTRAWVANTYAFEYFLDTNRVIGGMHEHIRKDPVVWEHYQKHIKKVIADRKWRKRKDQMDKYNAMEPPRWRYNEVHGPFDWEPKFEYLWDNPEGWR
jgi:hypothetical protein